MSDPETTMKWWSVAPAGWSDNSEAAYGAWHDRQKSKIILDPTVAMVALAFGHGARAAYLDHAEWEALAARLQVDWEEAGNETDYPWEYVRSAVRSGWEDAAVTEEPAEPEMAVAKAETEPADALAGKKEPGTRVSLKAKRAKAETEPADALAQERPVGEERIEPTPPQSTGFDAARQVPGGRPDADMSVASTESFAATDAHVHGGRPDADMSVASLESAPSTDAHVPGGRM